MVGVDVTRRVTTQGVSDTRRFSLTDQYTWIKVVGFFSNRVVTEYHYLLTYFLTYLPLGDLFTYL